MKRLMLMVITVLFLSVVAVAIADSNSRVDVDKLETFSKIQGEIGDGMSPELRERIVKKYGFTLEEYEKLEREVRKNPELQKQLREIKPNAEGDKENKNEGGVDDISRTDREGTITLYRIFRRGGPFMWPILLFAAIAMGFIIERFIFFKRAKLNPREFIEELESNIFNGTLNSIERFCEGNTTIISKIIQKGLKVKKMGYEQVEKALSVAGSIEVATLERGLNILSALGNIVPMLGFLGTVSGMISAFSNIAAADQVNARLVAGGIEEALLTTAAGLIVAIPTLVFYNYFVHRIDVFIADVERLSSDILEKLIDENDKD
jgi:biopolymer transport protein ExbB